MIPLPLSDDQLKVLIDYAGFVPRRLRRQYLKEVAAKLYSTATSSEPSMAQPKKN